MQLVYILNNAHISNTTFDNTSFKMAISRLKIQFNEHKLFKITEKIQKHQSNTLLINMSVIPPSALLSLSLTG